MTSERPQHGGTCFTGARRRLLDAMVVCVCERGYAGVSVGSLCARARTSRRTFYNEFGSLQTCFLAVLDDGLETAKGIVVEAVRAGESETPDMRDRADPLDGARRALSALLAFMDDRPALARVWLVESLAAGSWAMEHRERNITALTEQIIELTVDVPEAEADRTIIAGVMASVLGLLQRSMLEEASKPLTSLLIPLSRLIAAPDYGRGAQGREAQASQGPGPIGAMERDESDGRMRLDSGGSADADLPAPLSNPRARRMRQCVIEMAKHPGGSNSAIAAAVGISSHSQTSEILTRLARLGLAQRRRTKPGYPNVWFLTVRGEAAAAALGAAIEHQAPQG